LGRLRSNAKSFYAADMATLPKSSIAVIFVAQRTADDDAGYAAAAAAMDSLAAQQRGYLGIDSVRGTDGLGITVSYWASDADAKAWRDHPEHAAIRDAGRDRWYSHYNLHVGEITRSYDWQKP
jgi:heme-degrading monooxygenase HmoA